MEPPPRNVQSASAAMFWVSSQMNAALEKDASPVERCLFVQGSPRMHHFILNSPWHAHCPDTGALMLFRCPLRWNRIPAILMWFFFFLFESADYLSCVWVDIRLEVIQTNMDTISESLPASSRSTCRIGGKKMFRMLVFSGTSAPYSKRSTKETRSSSSTRVSVRAISGTGVRRQPFGHDLSLKYRVVSDAAGFLPKSLTLPLWLT